MAKLGLSKSLIHMVDQQVVSVVGVAPGEAGERDGDFRISCPRPSRTFTSGLELEECLEGNSELGADPGLNFKQPIYDNFPKKTRPFYI